MSELSPPKNLSLFFLYGPPGSGKSSAGRLLAQSLGIPFWDLDAEIEARSRASIPKIFARYGEAGFRKRERKVLDTLFSHTRGVISLGGGALLNQTTRARVEAHGRVVNLEAPLETLLTRLGADDEERPLLVGELRPRLEELLTARASHYASFPLRVETNGLTSAEIAWQIQVQLGAYHIRGMGAGYDVRVIPGCLASIGETLISRGLAGPTAVVSDENVAPFFADRVVKSLEKAGLSPHLVVIPAGESCKTLETVAGLWQAFTQVRLERGSTVIALGGGVVGDLAGFAAATYLRGIAWVAVPTSLLAMVDASLGGKTGFDLPGGKNLVGAFHAPRFVLADPLVLQTLPDEELRSGMAEVVKHGIISDPALFATCARGWSEVRPNLDEIVRRAIGVKAGVIQADPYEQGLRASLNLGHTLGHGLEVASGYRLRHGEAVSIGIVAATRLAVRKEIANPELNMEIQQVLDGLGLPTEIPPDLDRSLIAAAIGLDKKRSGGKVRFVLPVRIGKVRTGVEIDDIQEVIDR
jgi:3-dehydroquinate synthase